MTYIIYSYNKHAERVYFTSESDIEEIKTFSKIRARSFPFKSHKEFDHLLKFPGINFEKVPD